MCAIVSIDSTIRCPSRGVRRIDVAFGEAYGQARQEMREMQQFAVHATYRREAIAVRERAAQTRIDFRFVDPLVLDEVFCDMAFASRISEAARRRREPSQCRATGRGSSPASDGPLAALWRRSPAGLRASSSALSPARGEH